MTGSAPIEERELQQIRKLTEVSRALTYAVSLDEVLQLTVDRAVDLLGGEKSLLMIMNDEGRLSLRASHGVDAALVERFHEPFSETLIISWGSRSSRREQSRGSSPSFVRPLRRSPSGTNGCCRCWQIRPRWLWKRHVSTRPVNFASSSSGL
jgi:hypothetical protein